MFGAILDSVNGGQLTAQDYKVQRSVFTHLSTLSCTTSSAGHPLSCTTSSAGHPLPQDFAVGKAYPNPFNSSVVVDLAIPRTGQVDFKMYNILGQEILRQSSQFIAGYHKKIFNLQDKMNLTSGIFVLSVKYRNESDFQKLILLK